MWTSTYQTILRIQLAVGWRSPVDAERGCIGAGGTGG